MHFHLFDSHQHCRVKNPHLCIERSFEKERLLSVGELDSKAGHEVGFQFGSLDLLLEEAFGCCLEFEPSEEEKRKLVSFFLGCCTVVYSLSLTVSFRSWLRLEEVFDGQGCFWPCHPYN